MKMIHQLTDGELIAGLGAGKIAILKTDTIYGIVASVNFPAAIERIYALKQRDSAKACIVLIGETTQLMPGTQPTIAHIQLINTYWPGPTTIVLPVNEAPELRPVHRGVGDIAYRLPADQGLRSFLRQVGPLVAPSANPEGLSPATTIQQAVDYFGPTVDYYVDGGIVNNATPSQIIRINSDGDEEFLR